MELPLLLLAAFRVTIEQLHERLALAGHPDARPAHGFALQALGPHGVTISELGRRLGVTKQAAAKTAASLESLGYAARTTSLADARATNVRRTARGDEMLRLSAQIFAEQRAALGDELGGAGLAALEAGLATVIGDRPVRLGDLPAWLN